MTGINALFPSVDARRALKGVRKIHWCRAFGTPAPAPPDLARRVPLGGAAAFRRLLRHIRVRLTLRIHLLLLGSFVKSPLKNIYVTRFSELVRAVRDVLLVKRLVMTDSYHKANRRVRHDMSRALHNIMHSFLGV